MLPLTFDDFYLAQDCLNKLKWKESGRKSLLDDNMLIRELQKQRRILCWRSQQQFANSTQRTSLKELLESDFGFICNLNVTDQRLEFGPKTISCNFDLLEVSDDICTLTLVAPIRDNGEQVTRRNDLDMTSSGMKRALMEITFQSLALTSAARSLRLGSAFGNNNWFAYHLLLMNSSYVQSENDLRQNFRVGVKSVQPNGLTDLDGDLFTKVNVTAFVNDMRKWVEAWIIQGFDPVLASIFGDRPGKRLKPRCRKCEYRLDLIAGMPEDSTGFGACWGNGAYDSSHILNLPLIERIELNNETSGRPVIQELIQNGKVSMFDIPDNALLDVNNEIQHRTIESCKTGKELVSEKLKTILNGVGKSGTFVSVTNYEAPLSIWKGAKAYDKIAYMLSCHYIDNADCVTHHSWVHQDYSHPAADFLSHLYAFSDHTRVLLTCVAELTDSIQCALDTLNRTKHDLDRSVIDWAHRLLLNDEYSVIDMKQIAFNEYVHPKLFGNYSLKGVFDPIWRDNYHNLPIYLRERFEMDIDVEQPHSAYDSLPCIMHSPRLNRITDASNSQVAYYELVYGEGPEFENTYNELLDALNAYSFLESAAMLFIWRHWSDLSAN